MRFFRVFLSYSSKDLDAALLLKSELEARGCTVLMDKGFIEPGDDFEPKIKKSIDCCDCAAALLSEAACESPWVKGELTVVKSSGKKLFPVVLDASNPLRVFPISLANCQFIYEKDMKTAAERIFEKMEQAFVTLEPAEYAANSASIPDIEGKLLDVRAESAFLRRMDHAGETFSAYYPCLPGRDDVLIPYHELFGSARKDAAEFVEGVNMSCVYEDWKPELRPLVPDFESASRREMEISEEAGYDSSVSIPRLTLIGARERKDPLQTNRSSLRLRFGEGDYFEQRMFRQLMDADPKYREEFKRYLTVRGNNNGIDHILWGLCGGGTWVRTKDGCLAVSYRTNVAEEQGKLGYSASGGFDKYTSTGDLSSPLLSMMMELHEELGIDRDVMERERRNIVLISLGVDIPRKLIQFSYFWDCPLTSRELARCRSDGSCVSADEQVVFFIPFRKDEIRYLLESYELEPGAAFSLVRILQKEFGQA